MTVVLHPDELERFRDFLNQSFEEINTDYLARLDGAMDNSGVELAAADYAHSRKAQTKLHTQLIVMADSNKYDSDED